MLNLKYPVLDIVLAIFDINGIKSLHENKKALNPFYHKKTFLIENECNITWLKAFVSLCDKIKTLQTWFLHAFSKNDIIMTKEMDKTTDTNIKRVGCECFAITKV